MAEGKICVCPQCGKKFKLKAEFSAASFACSACGATVWVEGKAPASKRAKTGARTGRRKGKAGATSRKRAPAPARGRRRGAPEEAEEGGRQRYEKPASNNAIILVIGAVALVGVGVAIFTMSGKDEPAPAANVADGSGTGADAAMNTIPVNPANPAMPGYGVTPTVASPNTDTGSLPPTTDNTGGGSDALPPTTDQGNNTPPTDVKKPRSLGNKSGKPRKKGTSRWDPPATLGHLETTPPAERKQIDDLIALMMDPQAGRDSLDAKSKLSVIGKPAFLPVLAAMAKVRDTITDSDTMEERLIESSLRLADQTLREMDGYLNSKEKGTLRPGIDKKYIQYILRLHYRRWQEVLKNMDEMPGPYDPSQAYDEDMSDKEKAYGKKDK